MWFVIQKGKEVEVGRICILCEGEREIKDSKKGNKTLVLYWGTEIHFRKL